MFAAWTMLHWGGLCFGASGEQLCGMLSIMPSKVAACYRSCHRMSPAAKTVGSWAVKWCTCAGGQSAVRGSETTRKGSERQ